MRLPLLFVWFWLWLGTLVYANQIFLGGGAAVDEPVGTLSSGGIQSTFNFSKLHLTSVSEDGFTTLAHPRFPSHQVRIKKSLFCDPTVR